MSLYGLSLLFLVIGDVNIDTIFTKGIPQGSMIWLTQAGPKM